MFVETYVFSYSYFAIFIMMILVGFLGVFPPSKLIYLFSGFLVFKGNLNFILVLFSGGLGHAIGNLIQYELARKKGMSFIKKFISYYPHFSMKDVKKIQYLFEKKGVWYLCIGKLLDPIKLIISFFPGLSKMNRMLFFSIVFITSVLWAGIFTTIGYFFGESFKYLGVLGVIIFIIAVVVIYKFYKEMNSKEVNELIT
jgi:alkaline phosphatase